MTSWQNRAVIGAVRVMFHPRTATRARGLRTLTRGTDPVPPSRTLRRRVIRRNLGDRGRYAVDRMVPDPTGQPGPPGQPVTGTAVIYLHGGAFVHGIVRQHWRLVGDLADATGAPVYVPHYGRAPEHTADEVFALVDTLVEHCLQWDARRDEQGHPATVRVHLAGDSAGGALALLAAQHLRDHPRDGVVVAGVTLISVALDLTMTNPQIPVVEQTDPWLSREGVRPLLEAWAGERDLDDPLVSPLYGDLPGLPPIHVFSGTRDICWPDVAVLERRAQEAGAEIHLHVSEGSPHVHVLLPTPEGRGDRATLLATVKESLAP